MGTGTRGSATLDKHRRAHRRSCCLFAWLHVVTVGASSVRFLGLLTTDAMPYSFNDINRERQSSRRANHLQLALVADNRAIRCLLCFNLDVRQTWSSSQACGKPWFRHLFLSRLRRCQLWNCRGREDRGLGCRQSPAYRLSPAIDLPPFA
jgi:hypothetical protein